MVGGAVVMIIVLVLVFPVLVLISGAIGSGLLGWLVNSDVDDDWEGSELLELSRQSFEPEDVPELQT